MNLAIERSCSMLAKGLQSENRKENYDYKWIASNALAATAQFL